MTLSTEEVLTELFKREGDHQDAIDDAYIILRDRGLLPKVTVHQYMCKRGCQIARVFRALDLTLCAVRDYKYSPGMNEAQSVAEARAKNTLDGNRHWPSHVYDIEQLARFGTADSPAGISMNCNHFTGTVLASEILTVIEGSKAGQKGKPTRL